MTGGKVQQWKVYFFTYKLENNLDDNSKIMLTSLKLNPETTYWVEGYYNR
jgi:hypothetical protein